VAAHPHRVEIARYLLGRGLDPDTGKVPTERLQQTARAARSLKLDFPDGLAPTSVDLPARSRSDPLPAADVVVVTWTVDELAGLAKVLAPTTSAAKWWTTYASNYDQLATQISPSAPARKSGRLGSYQLIKVGKLTVLLLKSELHLNQDRILQSPGMATLPVKDLFLQVIAEAQPACVITAGTAGSVFDQFPLGDVVVTRAAKFRLQQEFKNEPYNNAHYESHWQIPTTHLDAAEQLMQRFADELRMPPIGMPTVGYPDTALAAAPVLTPRIRLEQGGRDMPEFHPILTTDYFEYGTTLNRLDTQGAAVEMGDAALGLACSELADPPNWLVVRNMSDPVINGNLPAKEFPLNEQTTWAVGFYSAYGEWTSACGALAVWAVIAGLAAA